MSEPPIVLLDVHPDDAHDVHALGEALRAAGHRVELLRLHGAVLVPRAILAAIAGWAEREACTGTLRLMGAGLGGSLALTLAALDGEGGAPAVLGGIVAICPFLGFDCLMYRGADLGLDAYHHWQLRLARSPLLRGIAAHIACPALRRLGCWTRKPTSWARLAQCVPGHSMAHLLGGLRRPAAIVLDASQRDLNAERAKMQIPAMNALASAIIMPLGGDLTPSAAFAGLTALAESLQHAQGVHV